MGNIQNCEAVPVTGREGLWSCEMLKIPQCLDNRLTDGGRVVNVMRQPHSTPQKPPFSASVTHFC
jgi:hypothetical protein